MDAKKKNTSPIKSKPEPFKIAGEWAPQARVLKEKFPQLMEGDLKFEPGKEEQLVSKLATSLNKDKEEVMNIIRKGSLH
jgi:hypothetical protein